MKSYERNNQKTGLLLGLMCLVGLILCSWASNAFGDCLAYYGFNNLTATSDLTGNGHTLTVHGSMTSVTVSPIPLEGSGAASGFSDSNYFTIPNDVFTGLTSGALRIRLYNSSLNTPKVYIEGVFSNGRLTIYQGNNTTIDQINIPTTSGGTTFSATKVSPDRWLNLKITWEPGTCAAYLEDGSVSTMIGSVSIGAESPSFSAATVNIGNALPTAGGFSYAGIIDSVSVYSTTTEAEYTGANIKPYVIFNNWGSSLCRAGECAPVGAWRDASIDFWQAENRVYHYAGTQRIGSTFSPFTDGVNSEQVVDTLSSAQSRLTAAFPVALPSDAVIYFVPESADAYYSNTLTAFSAQVDALINSVNAYSPLIKQFLVTGPPTQSLQAVNMGVYSSAAITVANAAKLNGKNISVVDATGQSRTSCDNLHYDGAAGTQIGKFIAEAIDGILYPTTSKIRLN